MKTLADLLLARDLAELRINTILKTFISEANACLGAGVRVQEISFQTALSTLATGQGRIGEILQNETFKIKVTS